MNTAEPGEAETSKISHLHEGSEQGLNYSVIKMKPVENKTIKIKKMRKSVLCQDDNICSIKTAIREIELLKKRE